MADEVNPAFEEGMKVAPAEAELAAKEAGIEELPKQKELPLAEEKPKEEVKAEEAPKPEEQEKINNIKAVREALRKTNRELREAREREAQKTAQLSAEIEALKVLAARNNQDAPQPTPQPQQQSYTEADVDAAAERKLAEKKYNEDCNNVAATGQQRYRDSWNEAIAMIDDLGGFKDPKGGPQTMLGLLATDDPAKVLHTLGTHPEEYHRIMALPVERRIVEMGKIAMAPQQPKLVSQAPAPVNPGTGGRAGRPPEVLRDDLDDDQWYTIRDKMRLQYRKAKGLIR